MFLLCLALSAGLIGSGCAALSLDLRRGLDMLTAWPILFAAQTAGVTLLVGGVFAALRPVPVAIGAVTAAVAEVGWMSARRRAPARRSVAAVRSSVRCCARWWRHPVVMVLIALVAAQYVWRGLCGTFMAKVDYDSLAYHLLGPDDWLLAGRITHSAQNLFSDTYPDDQGLLSVWSGLYTGTMRYAWVSHTPFILAGTFATIALARHFGASRRWSLVAALLWLATPVTYLEVATSMVDVATAATALAALSLALSALTVAQSEGTGFAQLPRHFLVAGAAAGLAVGVKSSNLLTAAFVVAICVHAYFSLSQPAFDEMDASVWRSETRRARRRSLATLLVPIAALGGYWYVRTAVAYGSPFYPVTVLGLPGRGTMDAVLGNDAMMPAILHTVPFGIFGRAFVSWATDLARGTYRQYGYSPGVGGFGLLWLTLILPAMIAGVVLVVRRRGHLATQAVIVSGYFLAWIYFSPASWHLRQHIILPSLGMTFAALALTRLARHRRALAALVLPAAVAAVAVTMWWTTNPTYYQVLEGGRWQSATVPQVITLMRNGQGMGADVEPNNAFTAVQALPRGSTIATAWSGGPMDYAHDIIGDDLRHHLVVLGYPHNARQLEAQMLATGARYVILGGQGAEPALLASVSSDAAQFTPLTTTGPIFGHNLYALRAK